MARRYMLLLYVGVLVCPWLSACQPGIFGGETAAVAPVLYPTVTPPQSRDSLVLPTARTSFAPGTTRSPTTPLVPTPTSFGGRLVFASRRDTNADGSIDFRDKAHLYVLDLETGIVTQLTFGDHSDRDPCWSPDGEDITFISDAAGNYDLFIVRADGSGLKQLTYTSGDEGEPAWSPEGTQIAYVLETRGDDHVLESSHLYLISVDGSNIQQLTDGPILDSSPDWSSDGRWLVFERMNPDWTERSIWLMKMPEGTAAPLDFPADSPAGVLVNYVCPKWLPQEGYLLSVIRCETALDATDCKIVVFEVEEREGRFSLRATPASIETSFFDYTWGPNGEWLIGAVQLPGRRYGAYDLCRVRVSLREPSVGCLWFGALEEKFLTDDDFYDDDPDWSP
ncbi:MAG: TolB family protein [Bacteroidota bacterium]